MTSKTDMIKKLIADYPVSLDRKKLKEMSIEQLEEMLVETSNYKNMEVKSDDEEMS